MIGYGFSSDAQVRAIDVRAVGAQMAFTILRPDHAPLPVVLNMPGVHNVRNALAAVAMATVVGVSDKAIVQGLAEFRGVGRRFTQYGECPVRNAEGQVTGYFRLVDDYGHHPHEMAATLAAVRGAWPDKRVIVAFQPHRYTRTRDCFDEFVKVLADLEGLVLAEVYPAGETPIEGATSEALAKAIAACGQHRPVVVPLEKVPEAIRQMVQD
ncbi:UDP-N-acetylmuramate-L-alanine ligase, partial [gut metagenome]